MMKSQPAARGIDLEPDLYQRHLQEQASDLPEEEWEGLRFFKGYRVPTMRDADLEYGSAEYVDWPEGVDEGYEG